MVYTDVFGFPYHVELSTKPENAIGDDAMWEQATEALREALKPRTCRMSLMKATVLFMDLKIDFHLRGQHGTDLAVRNDSARLRHARTL